MHPPASPPYPNPPTAIALVGPMGAGKSTVGPLLAHALGYRFIDLDTLIEAQHGPIPTLFERGESSFRDLESEVLTRVPHERVVLSCGGGTSLRAANRLFLESRFHTVLLAVPENLARSRIGDDEGRPLAGREGLVARRMPFYRSARSTVDATPAPEVVVDRILAVLGPRDEDVDGYRVRIRRDFSGFDLQGELCIADATVDGLYAGVLSGIRPALRRYTFSAGGSHKTIETWSAVIDAILADGVTRADHLIGLGGGVSGDLAGFVAASLLRGIPWSLVPTTTLAMVDSSVGGKVGLDHPRGKNLIGAFHRPSGVWIALDTLDTLPEREHLAGIAEAVKTGLVADPALFDLLEIAALEGRLGDKAVVEHVIALCVRAKAAVVRADEREGGLRRILNAGHTVGHAVETAAGGRLLHGEAVAIGLVTECRHGERLGVTAPGTADRVQRLLGSAGLPTEVPDLDRSTVVGTMALDKKADRDTISVPFPTAIGACTQVPLPKSEISSLLT